MFQQRRLHEIDHILIQKKNYISIRSMEPMENDTIDLDVIGYLEKVLDSVKENGDLTSFITEDLQERIKVDSHTTLEYNKFINILRRYVNEYTIEKDTIYQKGCNYRVDIKFPSNIELIGDKYYRIFLSSCDSSGIQDLTKLKIDNITYISDINDVHLTNKLVCIMVMNKKCIGTIELISESITYKMKVSGSLGGLEKYKNKVLGLHIHTQGDISDDCKKCGVHYNPTFQFHGDISGERHLGDLGNITIDENGNCVFETYFTTFPLPNDILLHNFLGRSIVLHDSIDDLGNGQDDNSVKTGDSGNRIACGVIGGVYTS